MPCACSILSFYALLAIKHTYVSQNVEKWKAGHVLKVDMRKHCADWLTLEGKPRLYRGSLDFYFRLRNTLFYL
ncbi:hypothetical protein BJ165DRAFT_1489325 [Panaeolus papilionaceus]|nr:hypothetical protein BJ165DRAFT_1489325 [Panaeolus papilionaceus]